MAKKMLVVVDYQNDFVDGALGFPGAEKLDHGIAQKIKEFAERGDHVVVTLDTHYDNYLDTREGKALPVPHCIEGTHGVLGDKEVPMFKDPITDKGKNGAGKKSQKGMCIVVKGEDGQLTYTDGHTEQETLEAEDNLLQPVFLNGELLRDEDFDTIRNRLHPNF